MAIIEKHKALIITSMLMGIFILTLYNINMVGKQKIKTEMLIELPLEEMAALTEQEEEDVDEVEQEDRKLIAAKRTHDAFNEDFDDPDHQEFEERMKALTEDPGKGTEGDNDMLTNADGADMMTEPEYSETKKEDTGNAEDEKASNVETNNRNSSLSYTLKNRKALRLPNPIYTCEGSGKVVVKIEVNKNGYVYQTKIDKRNSTTRNECLFDNAMVYAKKALFSSSTNEEQKGSITYYFNYAE
ncbi:hypothetical protein [Aquimarina intermedia]|uniref:TonB family protein n=1 Tax=Aquimarina intermedia TaxID=350814 RepID=A0A5S5CFL5_9FLAO|nr:hypothetical protein [Aquimarina intermedia]TYP77150.1 hypothetical protein BD809_101300 [Aquimarina intermedia]